METFQPAQHPQRVHSMMEFHLTPESLLAFSRHVLDSLSPALAETLDSSEVLISTVCEEINRVFKALTTFSPTPHLLRETKIHLALKSICEPDGGWPDAISGRAEGLLTKWHDEISQLEALEDIVWGETGALAGCSEICVDGERGWFVDLKNGKQPKDSLVAGELGFCPGFWWINRAAAVRDGIINSICNDITFDGDGAYAVIITGDREVGTDLDSIDFDGTGIDGCVRLLRSITRPLNLVRVLREHTSISPHAPEIGIRYEGVYRVSKFFNKLEASEAGSDRWIWRVRFERDEPKNPGPLRLARPNRDDKSIWKKYASEREDHITELTTEDIDNDGRYVF